MGLLSGLLTLPLAPVKGVVAAAEQVRRQAEEEFYDPATIRSQLAEVERQRADGALDEAAAVAWEDELIERLMAANNNSREG